MNSDQVTRNKIVKDYLNNNVLVRASAGSGKTSILVERVVAMIESRDDIDISEIVAITFTKKAANEFYARLYEKLEKRSEPGFTVKDKDPDSLLLDPDDDMRKRDLKALKYIDTCFLGTIDSFVQTILTEHPIDANIPTSSEIIEDDDLTTILVDLYHKMASEDLWGLKDEALNFNTYIGAANFPSAMKTIINNRNFEVVVDVSKLKDNKKQVDDALKKLEEGLTALFDVIKKDGLISETQATKTSREAYEYLIDKDYIFKHITDPDYSLKSKLYNISKIKGMIIHPNHNELSKLYDLCNVKQVRGVTRYTFENKMASLIHRLNYDRCMPFLLEAKDKVVEYLRANGKITFKESLIYAVDLLRKDDGKTIDVIRNIQKKYKYYLLDECQDTDLLQYELLFRLNSLERKADWKQLKIEDDGRLFIVGDRKQSIYHFRGADVRAYDLIEKMFDRPTNPIGKLCELSANFRSNDNLKNYFNETFKSASFSSLKHPDIPLDSKNVNKDMYTVSSYLSNKKTEPEKVVNYIKKINKEFSVEYRDVMLITSNKDNIKNYLAALNAAKVPCFCEGSIDFSFSSMLVAVANLFNYLIDPNDLYNRLGLLSSPLFNFDLSKTIDINNTDLFNFINVDLNQPSSCILEQIINNQTVLERLGYAGFDLLVAIIFLLKEEEISGNINSLYDAVLYLKDLQENSEIERVSLLDNQIDAVHVANLHKVKGLESSVVILTKAGVASDKTIPQHSDLDNNQIYYFNVLGKKNENTHRSEVLFGNVLDNDELQKKEEDYGKDEDDRLLYVAATRAKRLLLINKPEKGSSKWAKLITTNVKPFDSVFKDKEKNDKNTIDTVSASDVINPSNVVVTNHADLVNQTYEVINASTISSLKVDNEEDIIMDNAQELSLTLVKDKKDSLLFGTIVHKLMEDIVISKSIKLDISICDAIAKEYDANHLLAQLKQVYNTIYSTGFKQVSGIDDNIYELIKNNECHAEVPFAIYNNHKISNGVIDLLIITDKEIIVIDYKTDVKEIDHTDQLEAYKAAVMVNYPNKVVKTAIYHIY